MLPILKTMNYDKILFLLSQAKKILLLLFLLQFLSENQ